MLCNNVNSCIIYYTVLPIHTFLEAIKIPCQKVGCILLVPINVHGLQLRILSDKIRGKIYKKVRTLQNAGGWHLNFYPFKVRARRGYWTMLRMLVLIIQGIKALTALIINMSPPTGITHPFLFLLYSLHVEKK